jgi:hypothetical protein
MKIFHAVNDANIVPMFYDLTGRKLNILIAYNNLRGQARKLTIKYREAINLLYLDSGAFSVYKNKEDINVHEYLLYLQEYGDLFDAFFTLDDKFDDATHNLFQQINLETGLKGHRKLPIPVVHDETDPFKEFELYVEMGHNYIALGSMGEKKKIELKQIEKIMKKYPHIKMHMFGTLNREILTKYRPYSADAASWADHAKIGCIYYWDSDEKKEYSLYMGGRERTKEDHIHFKKFDKRDKVEDFFKKTFNYKYDDFRHSNPRYIVNLYFFTQLEGHLNSMKTK